MKIEANEISALIKEQIKSFAGAIEDNDVGTVISVGDGIALIYGLENAMLGELLLFPNDIYGMVMNLNQDDVGAVLLGSDVQIKEGDSVKRTAKSSKSRSGMAFWGGSFHLWACRLMGWARSPIAKLVRLSVSLRAS